MIYMIKKTMLLMLLMMLSACTVAEPVEEVIIEPLPDEELSETDVKDGIDLSLKPNEMGQVMVLMYHNVAEEESTWTRSVENFKKDLSTLYDQGYRPVSLQDYVLGTIDLPIGMTPVVLTFDDGNLNNFRLLEDGSIDPDCVVGILLAFHERHPDFPLRATFFITGAVPFRQADSVAYKLNFLIEKGMDIGNHTLDHINFTQASAEDIQSQIGKQKQRLEQHLNDQTYQVNTLALTYGSRPKDKSLEIYLHQGSYQDQSYVNIALLNVGSNPSRSPFDSRFNPLSIPRIRASEMDVEGRGLYDYLAYFEKNPEFRYRSDGVPSLITVPKQFADHLKEGLIHEVFIYE
jgi:peptidoglycan/xylan/chitin deacetylase (PgdA/CDA1 family)